MTIRDFARPARTPSRVLRRLSLASVAALGVSLSLVACSGDGEDAAREGYDSVSEGIVQVDIPADLVEVEAPESSMWELIYQDGDGEAGGEGVTTQVLIAPELEGATTAMDGPSRFLTLANMGAYEEFRTVDLEDRPAWEQEVDAERNADERSFVRHRYVWEGPDGTEYNAVTWGVYDGGTSAAMIQYVSSDLDEDVARTIDESIVVGAD